VNTYVSVPRTVSKNSKPTGFEKDETIIGHWAQQVKFSIFSVGNLAWSLKREVYDFLCAHFRKNRHTIKRCTSLYFPWRNKRILYWFFLITHDFWLSSGTLGTHRISALAYLRVYDMPAHARVSKVVSLCNMSFRYVMEDSLAPTYYMLFAMNWTIAMWRSVRPQTTFISFSYFNVYIANIIYWLLLLTDLAPRNETGAHALITAQFGKAFLTRAYDRMSTQSEYAPTKNFVIK